MDAAAQAQQVPDLFEGQNNLEVVNFYVNRTKFATPVSQVRYIEQDQRETTRIDSKNGHNEVTTYQEKPVPIFDFSDLLNTTAEYKQNLELIEKLREQQKEHELWVKELETAIRDNTNFRLPTEPEQSKIGQIINGYKPRDNELKELLASFNQIHDSVYELASLLRSPDGEQEKLKKIESVRTALLERSKEALELIIERLESVTKPILLYVDCSLEGKSTKKLVAIRLNAIEDILSYPKTAFSPAEDVSDEAKALDFVAGYLRSENQPPCVLLDWRLFHSQKHRNP